MKREGPFVLVNSPDTWMSSDVESDPKAPLGLLSIAGYLEARGFEVHVVDGHVCSMDRDEFAASIASLSPSVIGFSITTPNAGVVYDLVGRVRGLHVEALIVAGGPHATTAPRETLEQCPGLDGVVLGEGEDICLQLAKNPSRVESMPGYLSRGGWAEGLEPRLAPRMDLANLTLPAYHLIDTDRYLSVSRELYVATSRGCRYSCVFCSMRSQMGMGVTFRTAKSVVDEMFELRRTFNVERFYFYDDNLTIWPDLAEFVDRISGRGFSWVAQSTVRDLTSDTVSLLSKGGCHRISLGIESGSPRVQAYIGKKIDVQQSIEAVRALRTSGISSRGYFILGFPNETASDMAATMQLMLDLRNAGMDDLAIFPARPYPGTRLHDDWLASGNRSGPDLYAYDYLDDYLVEEHPTVRDRLRRYNTIHREPVSQYFSPLQVRAVIRLFYQVFFSYGSVEVAPDESLGKLIALTLENSGGCETPAND